MKIESGKILANLNLEQKTKTSPAEQAGFDAALTKAAKDLEALHLKLIVKEMKVYGEEEDGLFGSSLAKDFYRDMLEEEFAKVLTEKGGIGFSQAVLEQNKKGA